MALIEARLKELGIELPKAAVPVGSYVPYVVTGTLIFVSGQITLKDGAPQYLGKLGGTVSLDEGYQAARLCGLNLIAQAKAACDGNLDLIARVVKLSGFVNCTPDFTDQPKVVNGASDLMVEVFGERGRHARAAVGAPSLPLGVSVEVEAVFEMAALEV
jgi:enamine deaminase RidA (YjgF/YER057c/UK114 family)